MIFKCPHCAQELSSDSEEAGWVIDCPKCCKSFRLPEKPSDLVASKETPVQTNYERGVGSFVSLVFAAIFASVAIKLAKSSLPPHVHSLVFVVALTLAGGVGGAVGMVLASGIAGFFQRPKRVRAKTGDSTQASSTLAAQKLARWTRTAVASMSNPLMAILAGLGLLVLSWLFPPWIYTIKAKGGQAFIEERIGFAFLFKSQDSAAQTTYAVDIPSLVLIDLCIVAISAGAFLTLKHFKKGKS